MNKTISSSGLATDNREAFNIPPNGNEQNLNTHELDHKHGIIHQHNSELIFSLVCGVLLGTGFGLSFIGHISPVVPIIFYIGAYFFGGFYTTGEAYRAISKGAFDIDFLMLVAAIGAAFLGQWNDGALLLFLFSLGHALEHLAMEKARKSISALADLAPKTAFLKTGSGVKEVKIEELKIGDVVLIKPHTKIAADGIVTAGSSSVNQAPITGESMPVDKTAINYEVSDLSVANQIEAEHVVFAGSINGSESLEVKVSKPASDSTISRLVKMVNEAQAQKIPYAAFYRQV